MVTLLELSRDWDSVVQTEVLRLIAYVSIPYFHIKCVSDRYLSITKAFLFVNNIKKFNGFSGRLGQTSMN